MSLAHARTNGGNNESQHGVHTAAGPRPTGIEHCGPVRSARHQPPRVGHGRLAPADERRGEHAGAVGEAPRARGDGGDGRRARRALHAAAPLVSRDRVACDPWKAIGRIRGFAPRRDSRRDRGAARLLDGGLAAHKKLRFTTSFHTRYPEYLSARVPVVPVSWGYDLVRWFHGRAQHTLVSSMSLLHELQGKRVGGQLVHWPRGVDADVFHPSHRRDDVYAGLPGPIPGSTSGAWPSRRAWRTS